MGIFDYAYTSFAAALCGICIALFMDSLLSEVKRRKKRIGESRNVVTM